MGLTPARRGRIVFAGADIAAWRVHRIGKLGVGLVPEGRQVFPTLTVRENLVATAANRAGRAQPWTLEGIYDLFPRLGERQGQFSASLSGGEQQMLAVGRALMTNPRLLILDEATEGLAPLIRAEIWAVIERLKRDGLSILLIDKNLSHIKRVADRHYILEKGRVVWTGTSRDLTQSREAVHRYLGV
jgi:branched-chain amino acid transport system ATP-binding protein